MTARHVLGGATVWAAITAVAAVPLLTGGGTSHASGASHTSHASGGDECSDWSGTSRAPARLVGLPDTLVAGAWSTFTIRVENDFGVPVESLHPFVDMSLDADVEPDPAYVPDLEWRVGTGWRQIGDVSGYFAVAGPLEPGDTIDIPARVRLPEDTILDAGWFLNSGVYVNEDGPCQLSPWGVYDVAMLAPGSDPGTPEDAEGQFRPGLRSAPAGAYPPLGGGLAPVGGARDLPAGS
ncbi:hypothetical protein [Streptomyces sp. SBT349]|uniref:hypothetical protein n=1 Tax=Streptomyces sp. SBT349 TaxID=1580539 RepID=UPI00066A83BE|nr:hypothetical protein [Streptomyces sp. SBT349]